MVKIAAAKPSLIPATLALLVLILFGYILFNDLEPGRNTEHDVNPPIEIIDEPPPLTVIDWPDESMTLDEEAQQFVDQLVTESSEPVAINENEDQFVLMGSTINIPDTEDQPLLVKDIVQEDLSDNALFYVHLVTEKDIQGLWGIVQAGLIDKFRQGLHIEGITPNKDMLQVIIPSNADEKLSSGFSSFLGKILSSKVDRSYIYNFKTKKMGRDANIIHPGQQLIMIHFSPSDLQQIYQFFSKQRNQEVEAFSVPS